MKKITKTVPTKEKKRSFGGKILNFKNKEEEKREKKHLAAYLNGDFRYQDGLTIKGDPNWIRVKEIWK